ncbi:DUF1232 domain-containing protein [Agromyces seonyuensis]|uniref:DUF1232 domain-containing protein n=1 Tax=Agromyces seonyuensis TaxID=2662446 RepID=A0A6I4P1F7_9MICO|nr:DUF1232 domain-containing protein [Agromyces seonyuensis]MWC00387.1 DUF1232 domain-containing protein [Agromyces seonyuensis]
MWSFLQAVRRGEHRIAPMTWVVAAAAVVYTISPIDLIPELLLGPLGFADDLGLWGIVIALFARERARWLASFAK